MVKIKTYVFLTKDTIEEMIFLWNKNKPVLDEMCIDNTGQFKRFIIQLGIRKFKELYAKGG